MSFSRFLKALEKLSTSLGSEKFARKLANEATDKTQAICDDGSDSFDGMQAK